MSAVQFCPSAPFKTLTINNFDERPDLLAALPDETKGSEPLGGGGCEPGLVRVSIYVDPQIARDILWQLEGRNQIRTFGPLRFHIINALRVADSKSMRPGLVAFDVTHLYLEGQPRSS